mgnify:CR=1 FL=1
MKSRPLTLTRQQWLRGLFLWAAVPAPMTQLLLDPAYATLSPAHASSPSLPPQAQEDRVTFRADDLSFEFKLPSGWVGGTPVSEERASPSHIIAVSAQKPGTTASLRAVVEGGSRGRNYGRSLADLGSVSEVAGRLVSDELFKDDDAKDAVMIDYEQVGYSLLYPSSRGPLIPVSIFFPIPLLLTCRWILQPLENHSIMSSGISSDSSRPSRSWPSVTDVYITSR